MTVFSRRKFEGFDERDTGSVFEGYTFNRCEFDDCVVSMATRPELRATIRNCQLIRCVAHQNCTINTSIVEDCLVEDLQTKGQMFLHGAAFRHVVLRGRFGRIMLARPNGWDTGRAQLFVAANDLYYSGVDWALDLTQCQPRELYLTSVPGHLVRRDPTTQILVTLERALARDWQHVNVDGTPYDLMIKQMIEDGRNSEVFVAPHGHRSFAMHIEAQKRLRDAGIAEPD